MSLFKFMNTMCLNDDPRHVVASDTTQASIRATACRVGKLRNLRFIVDNTADSNGVPVFRVRCAAIRDANLDTFPLPEHRSGRSPQAAFARSARTEEQIEKHRVRQRDWLTQDYIKNGAAHTKQLLTTLMQVARALSHHENHTVIAEHRIGIIKLVMLAEWFHTNANTPAKLSAQELAHLLCRKVQAATGVLIHFESVQVIGNTCLSFRGPAFDAAYKRKPRLGPPAAAKVRKLQMLSDPGIPQWRKAEVIAQMPAALVMIDGVQEDLSAFISTE